MWSAVLGLAGSALGAFGANRQAKAAEKASAANIKLQKEQMERMFQLAKAAGVKTDARNTELRAWEQWARSTAGTERAWQIQESERYADQLMAERQHEIDRQVLADQEAARIQVFRLQEMLRNQNIAADERRFAEQQLQQAQAIASQERTEDLKRYYESQHRAQIQRDFMMSNYQEGRDVARMEQDRDIAHRDRLTGMIDGLRGRIDAAHTAMGSAPEIERMTRAELDGEITRRQDQYQSDVDRAADRMASVGEAGLMRDGMDRSTTGTQVRGEIAGRLADEYQTARNRAYDDALAYITGRHSAMSQNVNDIMANRGARLSEVAGVGSAGIQEMLNLPGIQSQLGAFELAQLVGDGNYDRAILSANDYRAPVDMGSALYESDLYTMIPGMSNFNIGTSAAVNRSSGVGSAITDPLNLILETPSTYYGAGTNIGANIGSTYANNLASAQTRAINAGAGFGDALGSFLNDNQSAIDAKLGSWFGFGGSGSSSTSFAPTTSVRPQARPTPSYPNTSAY